MSYPSAGHSASRPGSGAERRGCGPCPLCGRPLVPGPSVNEHHLIPRTYKGTSTVLLHRVCHGKIHSVLSEKELRDWYHTIDRLRSHPEIADFVDWVRRKDPEWTAPHRGGSRGRRR
jgi:hypothetical protein